MLRSIDHHQGTAHSNSPSRKSRPMLLARSGQGAEKKVLSCLEKRGRRRSPPCYLVVGTFLEGLEKLIKKKSMRPCRGCSSWVYQTPTGIGQSAGEQARFVTAGDWPLSASVGRGAGGGGIVASHLLGR